MIICSPALLSGCADGSEYYSRDTSAENSSFVSEVANAFSSDTASYSSSSSASGSSPIDSGSPSSSGSSSSSSVPSYSSSRSSSSKPSSSSSSSSPIISDNLPLINFDSAAFIEYPTAKSSFKTSSSKNVYMYEFNSRMSVGFDCEDAEIFTEAFYGLTSSVAGQKISVKAYNYTNKILTASSARIENLDKNDGGSKTVPFDVVNTYTLNTSGYPNGLYKLETTFSNNKTACLYFYVNGSDTKLCRVEQLNTFILNQYISRTNYINSFISRNGITPSKYLSNADDVYPYPDWYTWRCDTDVWEALSDTLVKSSSWSDEHKAFTFIEWIRDNIPYDYYKSQTIKVSRAHYNSDFSGKYSTYDLRVGVCADFSEILAIMCRRHGIPALVIDNDIHAWNLIYVNGRWREIDITENAKYGVYGEDVSKWVTLTVNNTLFNVLPHSSAMADNIRTCDCYSLKKYKAEYNYMAS